MKKGLTVTIILVVSLLVALGIYTKAENNETEDNTISINTKSILLNWKNAFGGNKEEQFQSVITTNDGYVVAGYSASTDIEGIENKGSNDATIIKYSSNGEILWKNSFGGNNDDRYNSIIETDNNYIAVGYISSTNVEGIENKGSSDAIIVKYDANGNIIWHKTFGGNGNDYFKSIKKVEDGYIVVGYSASTDIEGITNQGSSDAIIIKYDNDGNIIWQKTLGGNGNDYFQSVIVNLENQYIVVGSTRSTNISGFSKTNQYISDAIIVKYDSEGNIIWKENYGGSYNNNFSSIIEADNGYIAIGGTELRKIGEYTNQGYSDGLLVKYNYNGDILWQKSWGGNANDSFSSIVEIDSDKYEYMISGYSQSTNIEGIENKGGNDAVLLKIDVDGNILWKNSFGGNNYDSFNSITKTSKGFLAVGYSQSTNIEGIENKGSYDSVIANYTMNNETYYKPTPTYECISDVKYKKTISYNSFNKGDAVEYNGESYYVLENSDNNTAYVTLLKEKPLTAEELNKYGTDENNHLFVNEYSPNLSNPEKPIYEFSDGSGGMSYYSSETCGYGYEFYTSNYVAKDLVVTGCTSNYETSDVKKVVDAWANANFESENLIEVDGYKARLISIDDMLFKLGYDLSGIQTNGYELKLSSDVPSWAYDNAYKYWTMSEYMSSNSVIRVIESGQSTKADVYDVYAAVKPVVNVNKCIIDGGCVEESVEIGVCDSSTDTPVEEDKEFINKNAAEYLVSKANAYTDTVYADGNMAEMYQFVTGYQSTTSSFLSVGYRYIGDKPNNYVYFNCKDDNNVDTCEVWRIIGVLETENENGKLERRVKLIKDSTKKAYTWNSTESNDWTKSSLNKYLNSTFYNSLSDTAKSMIGDSKYFLGKLESLGPYDFAEYVYSDERRKYAENEPAYYWIGKVGLMYLSDYMYTYEYKVDNQCNEFLEDCYNEKLSWIYNSNVVNQWTLTLYGGYDSGRYNKITPYSYAIYNDASVHSTNVTTKTDDNNISLGIRPVVYLDRNVYITEGNGSVDSPYRLSLEINEDENEVEYDYEVGDSVTYNGVQYYVIKNSTKDEEYVTLIKALTLTADQVNKYSNGEYVSNDGAIPFSISCSSSPNVTACVDSFEGDYETSFIKYIVNNWAADELKDEDLVEVDGYKIRLITVEELYDNLGFEKTSENEVLSTSNTLDVFRNTSLKSYWTMSKIFTDSNYYKRWEIYSVGIFVRGSSSMEHVKPVINLKKSAIGSVKDVTDKEDKPSEDEKDESKDLVCKEKTETYTRYNKYNIGDIVKYNGEEYIVIHNSGYNKKYLTLLKNKPLTFEEIQKYNTDDKSVGSIYFSDKENTTYNESTIKKVIDTWTANELDENDLVEVNGYKSSILMFNDRDDFCNLGFCSGSANEYIGTTSDSTFSSFLLYNETPFWIYFGQTFYNNDGSTLVSAGPGRLRNDNYERSVIKNYTATSTLAVRPVINLLKTAVGDKNTYSVGDEVVYKGEKYHVISNSDESKNYITLLKYKPLTREQIYSNADESIKVNKIAYYNESNCESGNLSECVVTYETSNVKSIVDGWASDNINDDLIKVDGYKARLITTDELTNNLGYTEQANNSGIMSWYYTEDTPNSIYEVDGFFWTMDTEGDYYNANKAAVYAVQDYIISNSVSTNNLVRPVVNIDKCVFEGGCIYDEVVVESCEYVDKDKEENNDDDDDDLDDTPSESTNNVPVENTLKSPNNVVSVVCIVLVVIGSVMIIFDYIKKKSRIKNVNK